MCADVSPENKQFVTYKLAQQQFFSAFAHDNLSQTTKKDIQSYQEKLTQCFIEDAGYRFLAKHYASISQEYKLICARLQEKAKKPNLSENALDSDRLLAIHYAILLMSYDARYYGPDSNQVQTYQNKIRQLIEPARLSTATQSWQAKMWADLLNLASTPLHTSKIRDWLGFINIYRIHSVMCRMTWKNTWQIARTLNWLDQYDNLFGLHIDVGILDAPAQVSNALSVILFASRFLLNFGLIIKHTYEDSALFWDEIKKRYWVMVNDAVWGTVNTLTNFNQYFHIANATAGWMIWGFLIFDAAWLGWRLYVEHENYNANKACYELALTQAQTDEEQTQINEELQHLRLNYIETLYGVVFCIGAASCLVAGFSVALLFTNPAFMPAIGCLMCTLGAGMYLSAGQFGSFMKIRAAHEDSAAAWNTFTSAVMINTFMPLLLVGMFTVSWPAAVILTVLYIGYECSHTQSAPLELTPLKLADRVETHGPENEAAQNKLFENISATATFMQPAA